MKIEFYKRGQGKYTRILSSLAGGIIAGTGCYRLYEILFASEWGLSRNTMMLVSTLVPAGIFIALLLLVIWLVNKPSVADFMISAEGEMKKVNWSSRKEIMASTTIVIIVVIFFAVLLGVSDLFFNWFFMNVIQI